MKLIVKHGFKKMSDEHSISTLVVKLEDHTRSLKKRIQELETLLKTRDEKILVLKGRLKYEKLRNSIFTSIVKSCTHIKIDDIFEEEEDSIHIYKADKVNIPVIVHDFFKGEGEKNTEKNTEKYSISSKPCRKGKTYRAMKKDDLVQETPEKQEEKIKIVETQMETIVQENKLDVSYVDSIKAIDEAMECISKERIYKKHLISIKDLRVKLICKIGLSEYTNLIRKHIEKLTSIFGKKGTDAKKTTLNIGMSLSPLEQRLIFFSGYFNTELEPEETQRLRLTLDVAPNPKRYIPFNYNDFFSKMYNYGLSIFSVKESIKRSLVNPYGFPNIVYVKTEKSSAKDPYTFYILEKIEDDKRIWKMECRLYEFSKSLSKNILTYCINMFRRIYFDVFSDNSYREDYKDKCLICRQDCEQLLINIIELSNSKSLCETVRKIVSKQSILLPSKMDKFDFMADDRLVKKQYIQEANNNDDVIASIKRMFDDISDTDCNSIITSLIG
jgi:hypothetical protein